MEAIVAQIEAFEKDVVQWFNPALNGEMPPTREWYAVDLKTALAWTVAYLLLVVVGLFLKSRDKGWEARDEKKRADAKKGKKPSVSEKFAAYPINYIAALYNPAQVALCGYMIYEAMRLYREQDYAPICIPFDVKSTKMATVVWVFYISKIFDFMDTVFMVVKGSWKQLSFLHVYHHTSIFLVSLFFSLVPFFFYLLF